MYLLRVQISQTSMLTSRTQGFFQILTKKLHNRKTQFLDPENTMQDPTVSQSKEEHSETVNIEQFEDRMDTVTNNKVGTDVSDDKENEVNVDVDLNVTRQKQTKDQHSRKLIVLLDKYSNVDVDIQNDEKKKKTEQTQYTEREEDSEDALGNDSGIEMDGWEPDDVKKKKDRWAKKQTKTIATEDGSISVIYAMKHSKCSVTLQSTMLPNILTNLSNVKSAEPFYRHQTDCSSINDHMHTSKTNVRSVANPFSFPVRRYCT